MVKGYQTKGNYVQLMVGITQEKQVYALFLLWSFKKTTQNVRVFKH